MCKIKKRFETEINTYTSLVFSVSLTPASCSRAGVTVPLIPFLLSLPATDSHDETINHCKPADKTPQGHHLITEGDKTGPSQLTHHFPNHMSMCGNVL